MSLQSQEEDTLMDLEWKLKALKAGKTILMLITDLKLLVTHVLLLIEISLKSLVVFQV